LVGLIAGSAFLGVLSSRIVPVQKPVAETYSTNILSEDVRQFEIEVSSVGTTSYLTSIVNEATFDFSSLECHGIYWGYNPRYPDLQGCIKSIQIRGKIVNTSPFDARSIVLHVELYKTRGYAVYEFEVPVGDIKAGESRFVNYSKDIEEKLIRPEDAPHWRVAEVDHVAIPPYHIETASRHVTLYETYTTTSTTTRTRSTTTVRVRTETLQANLLEAFSIPFEVGAFAACLVAVIVLTSAWWLLSVRKRAPVAKGPPTRIEAKGYCVHCGARIGETDMFCMNCGGRQNRS